MEKNENYVYTDDNCISMGIKNKELLRIEKDGKFFVNGNLVRTDIDVFNGFKKWVNQSLQPQTVDVDEINKIKTALNTPVHNSKYSERVREAFKILDLLSQQPKEQKELSDWISVEDELPNTELPINIFGLGCVMIGYYYKGSFRDILNPHLTVTDITHWQPLPQPPSDKLKGKE